VTSTLGHDAAASNIVRREMQSAFNISWVATHQYSGPRALALDLPLFSFPSMFVYARTRTHTTLCGLLRQRFDQRQTHTRADHSARSFIAFLSRCSFSANTRIPSCRNSFFFWRPKLVPCWCGNLSDAGEETKSFWYKEI
jgi:hypothetical protein